jgi:hypothetical protein
MRRRGAVREGPFFSVVPEAPVRSDRAARTSVGATDEHTGICRRLRTRGTDRVHVVALSPWSAAGWLIVTKELRQYEELLLPFALAAVLVVTASSCSSGSPSNAAVLRPTSLGVETPSATMTGIGPVGRPLPAAYVGHWAVHGAELKIDKNGRASIVARMGPCCLQNVQLALVPGPRGVVGTVLAIRYVDSNGRSISDPLVGSPHRTSGDSFMFRILRQGLLAELPLRTRDKGPLVDEPVNSRWCGAGLSSALSNRYCGTA